MRDDLRHQLDTAAGDRQILVVRLDWRSLIPVVVLAGVVWLLGRIWETLLLLVVALILADALVPLMTRLERRGLGRVLSSKVGLDDLLALGGVVSLRRFAAQASAGVPVTARQVAKRSVLVWR